MRNPCQSLIVKLIRRKIGVKFEIVNEFLVILVIASELEIHIIVLFVEDAETDICAVAGNVNYSPIPRNNGIEHLIDFAVVLARPLAVKVRLPGRKILLLSYLVRFTLY